jgi:hypothetical protein
MSGSQAIPLASNQLESTLSTASEASRGSRSLIWSEGSPFQEGGAEYGQIQQPSFAGSSPKCGNNYYCSGGSGPITYHVSRPNIKEHSPSWRSMMILTSNKLQAGGMYDTVFQTVSHLGDDAMYSANLIWQDHNTSGPVNTELGVENYDGKGTKWYMNTGGAKGVSTNPEMPHTWEAPYVPGETDNWEIQFKNTNESDGWVDLYRNGVRVDHYSGPNVVAGTEYNVIGIGIYEWDWELPHASVLLSQSITFNSFAMYQIPGPIAPLAVKK